MRRVETSGGDRSATELLREIREKAEAERDEIVEAARRRAGEIEAQSVQDCERVERQGLADADRETAAERDRTLGKVREEARRERVAFKRAAIDDVFAAAEEAIQKRIGGSQWEAAMAELLDEATRFVGPDATVVVANGDLAVARKWTDASSEGCRVEGGPGPRGAVVATSSDARRRAENGIPARIRRVKESGAADIARVLFATR